MDVTVSIVGADDGVGSAEQIRSLFGWLVQEEELRGRVRLVEARPEPGTLGAVPTELLVALAQGGTGTALASAVVAWIRHRTGEVSYTLTRSDGTSVKVTGKRVRDANVATLSELVERVAKTLNASEGEGEGRE